MEEERYPDPMSMPQHIDEGETKSQQEEESYEVNKEWTEAIVREEDHGELIENFDIINENTEEVYEEDDEQQMELQDELEKRTNEIQIEPSDVLTSDIVNEGTETGVYGEDDEQLQDEKGTNEIQIEPSDILTSDIVNEATEIEVYEEDEQLQDELEIRNGNTENEEDDEQQLELQDELEKGTNQIQIEPSDILASDITNEGTETDVYGEDDEQLQDEKGTNEIQIDPSDILTSDIVNEATEIEVYEEDEQLQDELEIRNGNTENEEDDEQQLELQDELEKGTNQIQIDILASDITNEGKETDVYGEDDEQLQDESEVVNVNTEEEVYGEEEDEQQLQDENGTNEIQIDTSDILTSDIVNEATEIEVYEEDEQLQDESEIRNGNTEKEVYGEEDEQQLQDENGTNEIQIDPSDILASDDLLTEKTKEMAIQDNSQIQENGDDDDQSYSPPLQPQFNKENTPDYLEHQMIKTPPSSTSSKKITPSSRDSKGKRRSSDKVNYVYNYNIILIMVSSSKFLFVITNDAQWILLQLSVESYDLIM